MNKKEFRDVTEKLSKAKKELKKYLIEKKQ